jgi:hypothetical protein
MADKAIAVHRIKHDGVVFEPGEVVQGVSKDSLNHLVDAGAVTIEKSKPAPVKTRARTDEGHFVPDDPTTPAVDEAWASPPKKKKKAPAKKKS